METPEFLRTIKDYFTKEYSKENPVPKEAYTTDKLKIGNTDALLIIDMQNDFVHGSVGTKEGDMIAGLIADTAVRFKKADAQVFATKDYHGPTHVSFATEEKPGFPSHCVAGTWGAEFTNVIDELAAAHRDIEIYYKGMYDDIDSFGAFPYKAESKFFKDRVPGADASKVTMTGAWKFDGLSGSTVCGNQKVPLKIVKKEIVEGSISEAKVGDVTVLKTQNIKYGDDDLVLDPGMVIKSFTCDNPDNLAAGKVTLAYPNNADLFRNQCTIKNNCVITLGHMEEMSLEEMRQQIANEKATTLADGLKAKGVTRVFVAGLATQFCVLDTALNGALAGFDSLFLLDLSRRVADIPDGPNGEPGLVFNMKKTMITPILEVNDKAGKGKTTKLMSVGNLEYTQKKSKTQKEQ